MIVVLNRLSFRQDSLKSPARTWQRAGSRKTTWVFKNPENAGMGKKIYFQAKRNLSSPHTMLRNQAQVCLGMRRKQCLQRIILNHRFQPIATIYRMIVTVSSTFHQLINYYFSLEIFRNSGREILTLCSATRQKDPPCSVLDNRWIYKTFL